MEIILTSYKRPQYLKQTIEELRRVKGLDVYIIDGGGNIEIARMLHYGYAKKEISGFAILKDNPGADIARNIGILKFVTGKQFIVSTDDLLPPQRETWLNELQYSFNMINKDRLKFPLLSGIVPHYLNKLSHGKTNWKKYNNVWCHGVTRSDTIGAIVDTEAIKQIGLWPIEYGLAGYGTRALCIRMRKFGYRTMYLKGFIWRHIGNKEETDFPEQFKKDKAESQTVVAKANKDALGNNRRIVNYENLIETIRGQNNE